MSPQSNRRLITLAVATFANFGAVLVGLWAISRHASGDDQIALLNLWAAWGISLGLVGQVGLISGVLDRRGWYENRNLSWAAGAVVLTTVVLLPARSQLFAGRGAWALIAGAMAGLLYLLGRQRAALSLRQRGVSAVVVTAVENVLRAVLLTAVLVADQPSFGAAAIATPLVISFFIFSRLSEDRLELSDVAMTESRSVAVSLLAGIPAVLAYGVVPVLTLLGNVEDLDQVAFAATLLRGPLIIAGFLAPWFLERVSQLEASWRHRIVVLALVAVAAQILVAFLPAGIATFWLLLLAAAAAALAAVSAYLLVVLSPIDITFKVAVFAGGSALVAYAVTSIILREAPSHWSFSAVAVASLAVIAIVEAARAAKHPRVESPEASPSRVVEEEAA